MGLTVAQANALLALVKIEADLRNIIAQLDISIHGATTVLYNGALNGKQNMDAIA